MKVAVVIPACAGREDNVRQVLACLQLQSRAPDLVVLVEDGGALDLLPPRSDRLALALLTLSSKHEPGMEQPRNRGVRLALDMVPDLTHVWFLDSDVIVGPDCLAQLERAVDAAGEPAIVVAPYDWMAPGQRDPMPDLHNDPRWAMFNASDGNVYRADLSAGLACFSGNLLWPIEEFRHVGGFWAELHHGRCEDGELGIRAVAMAVPIVLAPQARGWHLWHPVNEQLVLDRNRRDVPMLNDRHPWMVDRGVLMVDRDGKAFDVRCRCGDVVPTIEWWAHAAACGKGMEL